MDIDTKTQSALRAGWKAGALSGADLPGADLPGADLPGMDLSATDLEDLWEKDP
jgi:uncharacterized protein YjbI with pentapeptide repeats